MIDVREFGVLGDGLTCCVSFVKRILYTLPETGGVLYFPAGRYLFTCTLDVLQNGVSFLGDGGGSTIFVTDQPDIDILRCGNSTRQVRDISLCGIGFNSLTPRTGGSDIIFRNVFLGKISNCFLANSFNGIVLENSSFIYLDTCMIVDPSPMGGIGVLIHGEGRHNDQYINKVFVQCQAQSAPCLAGFRIANTQGLWMTQSGAFHCNTGFEITATVGRVCEHLFLSQNHADTCTKDGWVIEAGNGAMVRRVFFSNDWSASNGGSGWVIRSSGGVVDDIRLEGGRAYSNFGPGMELVNCKISRVYRSTFTGNNVSKTENSEIVLAGTLDTVIIVGCEFGGLSGLDANSLFGVSGAKQCKTLFIKDSLFFDMRITDNAALENAAFDHGCIKLGAQR